MTNNIIKIGAVVYAPQVTVVWNIIADFFKEQNMPVECIFYKDYPLQVDGLFNNEIDIAWNSPLAWVDTFLRSQGTALDGPMRDTDRDRKTCLLVNKKSGFKNIQDLKGKTIGFGALDSPQARLIPIEVLRASGLAFGQDYQEKRFDIGIGLHGDHEGGELDAAKELMANNLDASWTLDINWEMWQKDGSIDNTQIECIATTPAFDHCIFSARPDFPLDLFNEWSRVLHLMDYNNPEHKNMMDLEGLKEWVPGRTSGFAQLQSACDYLNFFKNQL